MRFLVADDHSIVRMGLRLMLEEDYAGVTIDEAENGNEIVEKIKVPTTTCLFWISRCQILIPLVLSVTFSQGTKVLKF